MSSRTVGKGLGKRKLETKGENREISFVNRSQELVNIMITITLTFIMIFDQFIISPPLGVYSLIIRFPN